MENLTEEQKLASVHSYFLTRGIKTQRDLWVQNMASVKLPWKRKNLSNGKIETTMLGLSLRPIELWEVVVPYDCLQEMLAMQHTKNGNENSVISACNNLRPEIKNYAVLMQKLLGLKPYPEFKNPTLFGYRAEKDGEICPVNWVPTDGFAVYPLGIKYEPPQEFPNYTDENSSKGYFQGPV